MLNLLIASAIAIFAASWSLAAMDAVRLLAQRWGLYKRNKAAAAQAPEALYAIAACLRAGQTLEQALAWVGRELPPPLGPELAQAGRETVLGKPAFQALGDLTIRLPTCGFEVLARSLPPLVRLGANLVPVFEGEAARLRRQRFIEERLTTLTAQARGQLWLMALMPVVLVTAFTLIAPEFTAPLFESVAGAIVLATAALLEGVGIWLARQILRTQGLWQDTTT